MEETSCIGISRIEINKDMFGDKQERDKKGRDKHGRDKLDRYKWARDKQ